MFDSGVTYRFDKVGRTYYFHGMKNGEAVLKVVGKLSNRLSFLIGIPCNFSITYISVQDNYRFQGMLTDFLKFLDAYKFGIFKRRIRTLYIENIVNYYVIKAAKSAFNGRRDIVTIIDSQGMYVDPRSIEFNINGSSISTGGVITGGRAVTAIITLKD